MAKLSDVISGTFIGAQGVQGIQGIQGVQGVQGAIVTGVPQNSQTTGYTLVASDAGKHVSITTGGVTVPNAVFAIGDTVTIFNNSGSTQVITQGGAVTLRFSPTTSTGNRNLISYGIATLLCYAANTFVISGSGLT